MRHSGGHPGFVAVAFFAQAFAVAFGGVVAELSIPVMPAPTVDGSIGEAEWRAAAEMRGFVSYKSKVAFPAEARFLVGRDGERLYFAAETACGPDGVRRRVMPRKGNAPAFIDDSFEFVFCEDVDADIDEVDSIFNPTSGVIRARRIGELVQDPARVAPQATRIVIKE